MRVVWRWLAFSMHGVPRPVYHATRPEPQGIAHDPRWDRACGGKGAATVIDPDGREFCVACQAAVMATG